MTLARLAALYGVATSYAPSPDRTVQASEAAVVAALAALDVDASTPEAVRDAVTAREQALRDRLLPPTVVLWTDADPSAAADPSTDLDTGARPAPDARKPALPEALTSLPPGTRLVVETEAGARVETKVEAKTGARPDAAAAEPGPEAATGPDLEAATGPGPEAAIGPDLEAVTGPGPEAALRPGPEAALRPGPEAATEPGPEAAPRPGPEAAPRPGPEAATEPGPEAAPRPGPAADTNAAAQPAPGAKGSTPGAPLTGGTLPASPLSSLPLTSLPLGVHRLRATTPDGATADAHLVVAPRRAPAPPPRTYGFLVQLYSLLSHHSWGMGDLGDLAELASWSGRALGAGFVQVNPLHAAVPRPPGGAGDPSPYRPASRRFPDPVHLRVEDVPEFARLRGEARDRAGVLAERAARLRRSVLREGRPIDRDAVWELKSAALELIRDVPLGPGRCAAYSDFLAEHGEALEDHATWYALAERYGPDWHAWPAPLRDPASPETARARTELMDRVDFHERLAWLTDEQLAAAQRAARDAGMPVGLIHDLAVGVHPDGADAWAQQRHFAAGMSVGAPPDAFNARGQDWGLPPWRPDRLAESGYAPFRALLRATLRHAGAVRVDHVMGLFRLWWVPSGRTPVDGTYVRYDADAMLAVLALEAHRAGAVVIGEDLGTVEPGVREALRECGVLGTSVLWFERDWEGDGLPLPPERWRADCLATATTHDLPSTAARVTGDHVRLRHDLGLLARPLAAERAEAAADVREWLALISRLGLLPGGAGREEDEIRAVHRFLLATPARMIGVWLPDTVGDRRPQNLPGTWDQYPNWRLPVADAAGRPVTLEDLAASPRLHALLDVFDAFRHPSGTR